MSLFSWSAAAFACVDGTELVAWDPNLDAPTWRRPVERHVVAIAGGGTILATLDDVGGVSFYNGRDGSPAGSTRTAGGRILAMAWGSACAVATPERIEVLDAQGQRALPVEGATALRFSRDDKQLAVGLPDGRVTILDVASGAVVKSAQVA